MKTRKFFWILILTSCLSLLIVSPAYADNCSTPGDCYGSMRSGAQAAAAMALLALLLSLALDLHPVTGPIKGLIELVTQRDLITGDELTRWELALGVVGELGTIAKVTGALAAIAGGMMRHGDEAAEIASAVSRYGDNVIDAGRSAARHADEAAALGRHADEAADVGRHADEAAEVGRHVDEASDVGRHADEAAEVGRHVDEVFDDTLRGGRNEGAYETSKRLMGGNFGERNIAEVLADEGHQIVFYKPSILGTNQGGIDLVTIHDGVVRLIDNKALTTGRNVGSVSALTRNLDQNVDSLLRELRDELGRTTNGEQREVLENVVNAIERGDYRRTITNAAFTEGDNFDDLAKGLTSTLKDQGFEFLDVRKFFKDP